MSWDQQRVKQLRQKLGLSQAELARELGCRQQTVSEWELGLYAPANAYGKLLGQLENRMGLTLLSTQDPHQRSQSREDSGLNLNFTHEFEADSVDKAFDPAID